MARRRQRRSGRGNGAQRTAPQTGFVCETDHGCVALGLSEALITAIQNADPRCVPAP